MRMRCYKSETDCISNIIKEQEVTSWIAHPLDIVLFCTVLKGPLCHRMLLTCQCALHLWGMRNGKRWNESCYNFNFLTQQSFFQARLRQKSHFYSRRKCHSVNIYSCNSPIGFLFFRPTIIFFRPSLHE